MSLYHGKHIFPISDIAAALLKHSEFELTDEFWDFTVTPPVKINPRNNKAFCYILASTSTNSSGLSSLYFTDDKTITGNAIFSKIWLAIPVSIANVSPGVSTPQANIQAIPDNKTINISTTKGQTNLLGLTTSIVPAPNVNISLLIIAER